jgi:hypothetical protein
MSRFFSSITERGSGLESASSGYTVHKHKCRFVFLR